jgi:hypothetical protein
MKKINNLLYSVLKKFSKLNIVEIKSSYRDFHIKSGEFVFGVSYIGKNNILLS